MAHSSSSAPRENLPTVAHGMGEETAAGPQADNTVTKADFIPVQLDHFKVLQKLGQGGMGWVLLAEDTRLTRRVALKVMRGKYSQDKDSRERFLREARLAAGLKHDHIVTIYHVGEDRGIPYLAMELLEGGTLQQRLEYPKPLSLGAAVRIAREIAEDGFVGAGLLGVPEGDHILAVADGFHPGEGAALVARVGHGDDARGGRKGRHGRGRDEQGLALVAAGGAERPLAAGDGEADAGMLQTVRLQHSAHGFENEILGGRIEAHAIGGVFQPPPMPRLGERLAAMGDNFRDRLSDGARPSLELAAREPIGQRQMALAADHQSGIGNERARRRREPFGAILADADDGEPSPLLTGRVHNATSSAR